MQTKITNTKQKKESKKVRSEDLVVNRTKNKSLFRATIITNTIVASLIAFSPYFFQLYEYVPEEKIWETSLFTLKETNYIELRTAFWVYMNKAIPLFLMVLWFFTCNKWWYHVILIPMAMFGFQLFSAINYKEGILDVVEIYWLVPIMMIIVPFVYLIRIKLMDRLVHGIDMRKIDAELEEYERKEQEQKNLTTQE